MNPNMSLTDASKETSSMNSMLRNFLLITAVLVLLWSPSYGQAADQRESEGWTPLMYAAYDGHADRVKELIAQGANVNTKDLYHETALLKAISPVRVEDYDTFAPGASVGDPTPPIKHHLKLHPGSNNIDCIKALIAAGADLEVKDRDGLTALMESALQGYLDSVKALIDGGVNVNASARHGKTALMLAKTPEIADLLRAAGARK